jgi:dihydroneopterin aldolase
MLIVSLHGVAIHAPIGLYPEEKVTGNDFETDVDLWLPDVQPWPYADYAIVYQVINEVFAQPADLLEQVVYEIHTRLKVAIPEVEKVRVVVRKLAPPLGGSVKWSSVTYEQ